MVKKAGFAGVEAWTSTAHLKAAPDMVSGRGAEACTEGGEKGGWGGRTRLFGHGSFFLNFFFFFKQWKVTTKL